MNENVQAFLDERDADLDLQDRTYYYLVMKKAGLLSTEEDYIEVSEKEFKQVYTDPQNSKQKNGKYYIKRRLPLDVSDEEFQAIEAALPAETLNDLRLRSQGVDVEIETESSGAAKFFTVIAWLLFIGGLILALVVSITEEQYGYYSTRTVFNFTTFISTFITYYIAGCFSLCAAELFKKLQAIVNLLRRKG